ncbi:hypothetical protein NX862_17010 [Rhodobacter sp. KR11]|uniref:hypothetical protein n=1 Tax=Rhodobacter sp. KR11 TaxID=2974588 RepID=UPI0022234DAD|nr:hypothetical protein [Rhodobacter sp. KR11]MCW1920464.1 hypothetical protein [Rhodobacter sp. KR11]
MRLVAALLIGVLAFAPVLAAAAHCAKMTAPLHHAMTHTGEHQAGAFQTGAPQDAGHALHQACKIHCQMAAVIWPAAPVPARAVTTWPRPALALAASRITKPESPPPKA